MALKTTLAQLEEVQAAITEILTNGQRYVIEGSMSQAHARLAELQAREDVLLRRYRREQGTTPLVASANFSRLRSDVGTSDDD